MSHLAEVIRSKMKSGALPAVSPARITSGHGDGALCAACEAPVRPNQVERSVRAPRGMVYRFHLGCHGVWAIEVSKRAHSRDGRRLHQLVLAGVREHPEGICLACLALRIGVALAVVAEVMVEYKVARVEGVCSVCAESRRVSRV